MPTPLESFLAKSKRSKEFSDEHKPAAAPTLTSDQVKQAQGRHRGHALFAVPGLWKRGNSGEWVEETDPEIIAERNRKLKELKRRPGRTDTHNA